MRRYSWLITLAVVAAILFMRRTSVPIAAYPDNATPTAYGVEVAIRMQPAQSTGETWALMRQANGTPDVTLYNGPKMVTRFVAGNQLKQSLTGKTYETTGTVKLGMETYRAIEIHINADNKTGYILLHGTNTSGLPKNSVHTNSAQADANTSS